MYRESPGGRKSTGLGQGDTGRVVASAGQASILGDLPALNAQLLNMPDRRQVSLRWLAGAILVGVTSTFLMGGALFAALEGKQELASPGKAFQRKSGEQRTGDLARKGDQPGVDLSVSSASSNVMMVSTVMREGDRDVVKVRPFLQVATSLAVGPRADLSYPPYDPAAIFAQGGNDAESVAAPTGQIYGANVDSEVTLKQADFNPTDPKIIKSTRQRDSDIEELVRQLAPRLTNGTSSLASLAYFDPGRFSASDNGFLLPQGFTVTAENVTSRPMTAPEEYKGIRYEERIVRVRVEASVSFILKTEGMDEAEAGVIEKVLSADLGTSSLKPEDRVRIAFEVDNRGEGEPKRKAIRISVYRNTTHMVSIARTDDDRFIYAQEPDLIPQIASAPNRREQLVGRLPSLYDAVYRASLSEGLGKDVAQKLVRILASDVDIAQSVSPNDELNVFLSLEDGQEKPTQKSDVLFVSVQLGDTTRKYYRFVDTSTGQADYYDESGKNVRKTLLRQPVPGSVFRSPFGMRYHPILKVGKMHWGVDWAAPRGTPILAAGDGVVEAAGWTSGYGKHTEIKHINGYKTTYSHQNAIAPGIVPGAHVRQGQIIGYVGSTGLSTGPHLHFEIAVNGTKVDPMRIRLPQGKALKEDQLAVFNAERDRIDALLNRDKEDQLAQF